MFYIMPWDYPMTDTVLTEKNPELKVRSAKMGKSSAQTASALNSVPSNQSFAHINTREMPYLCQAGYRSRQSPTTAREPKRYCVTSSQWQEPFRVNPVKPSSKS